MRVLGRYVDFRASQFVKAFAGWNSRMGSSATSNYMLMARAVALVFPGSMR
jgi:hypothetical protein